MAGGRPKGSKSKVGLTVEQRLKLLTKLALDKSLKASDRINAISQITALLNDKVKDSVDGATETIIKFDNTQKIEKITEKITETITPNITSNITDTITTTTIQPVKVEEVKKENDELKINLIIKNE